MKITKSVLEKLGNYISVVTVNIIINCSFYVSICAYYSYIQINIKQFWKSMYNCLEIWFRGIIFAKSK